MESNLIEFTHKEHLQDCLRMSQQEHRLRKLEKLRSRKKFFHLPKFWTDIITRRHWTLAQGMKNEYR